MLYSFLAVVIDASPRVLIALKNIDRMMICSQFFTESLPTIKISDDLQRYHQYDISIRKIWPRSVSDQRFERWKATKVGGKQFLYVSWRGL